MHFYPGLSDRDLDRMDYLRFFGLLREMHVYQEEEHAAQQDRAMREAGGGRLEIPPEAWQEWNLSGEG